ncbi:AraC family transcriptional regulator [Limnobacter humi]|uniref:AraC family transcriptional regulator n=1 Tax=Limnobacter humi TaxID=1778671 RepID=A0ABT1WF43_9BURK|nr:AraC family transcriptional regulator [Limnobacter humi]MCQ8895372.1 AraC family transcriptional regulator [Limnobacter humi]
MNQSTKARRTVVSVNILCTLGTRLGTPLSALLTGSAISPAQLQDPHLEITPEQELQVIHNLVRLQSGTSGLGLMAGLEYHLTTFGIWGYALITSPKFRDAVHLGLRYLDLTYAFSSIEFVEEKDLAAITLRADGLPPAIRTFVIERDASAVQVIQRELFGVAMPLKLVEFAHQPSCELGRYEAIFGRVPTFGAPVSRVAFDVSTMDIALPKGSHASAALYEGQMQQLLSLRKQRGGTSAWIRNKLLANIASSPSLAQIASDHFMTERTLRRRLADEGTTFRDLLAEVRQTMAEELLLSTGLSVSEVSARLGYASTSAFIHAFQKWRNCSPRQFLEARTKEKQGQ